MKLIIKRDIRIVKEYSSQDLWEPIKTGASNVNIKTLILKDL